MSRMVPREPETGPRAQRADGSWHDRLRQRLRGTRKVGSPDLHQAKMRFAVLAACVLYASYIGLYEGALNDAQTVIAWLDTVLFGLFALHTYRHFKKNPAPEYWRRSIGLFADHGAALGCLAISGPDAAALAWLPLFIIQGVGFRFGVRWLFASQAIGLASIGLVWLFNPYFQAHPTITLGAALSVLVLPLYFAILAKREASIRSELVAARQEAEAANEAKGRFVAMVSHELRTPLTGISGLNEVLRRQALPAETHEVLAEQHAATQLMLTMVNDVLDLSKLEDGQMQPQAIDFDLQDLATNVFKALCFQAERKGLASHLEFEPSLPRHVKGSPFHVSRILQNLLGNAIKFTTEGAVTLRVRRALEPASDALCIQFEIEDTGIGIPADALPKVFDRFYQVDAAVTRRFGGTGLGTSIVKGFCDLLGGRVDVTSDVGKGSRFVVTLPFSVATTTPETTRHEVPAGLRTPRADAGRMPVPIGHVLVAEDTPTIQMFMRATLEAAGYRARIVRDGAQALAALSETPFDAVVMDWNMPERDGISVLTEIREAQGPNARTPVVFATAAPSQELTDLALRSGAQSVLSKPFTSDQLVEAVSMVVAAVPGAVVAPSGAAANSAEAVEPASLPVFDRAVFERPGATLGRIDPRLLVSTFVKDARQRKADFERSTATQDSALFGATVHSLTGYASSFGARRLAHLLATAPRTADDYKLRGRAATEAICEALDLTSAALEEWTDTSLHAAA